MGITQSKRVDNYMRQNGWPAGGPKITNRLTPRQLKRLRKKGNQLLRNGHDHAKCEGFEVHGDL
jgi:hypothetical protein